MQIPKKEGDQVTLTKMGGGVPITAEEVGEKVPKKTRRGEGEGGIKSLKTVMITVFCKHPERMDPPLFLNAPRFTLPHAHPLFHIISHPQLLICKRKIVNC